MAARTAARPRRMAIPCSRRRACSFRDMERPFGALVEANALDRAAEHQLPRIGAVTRNEDGADNPANRRTGPPTAGVSDVVRAQRGKRRSPHRRSYVTAVRRVV